MTEYAKASGVPFVNVEAGVYMENFTSFGSGTTKQADGTYVMSGVTSPKSAQPLLNTKHDYGLFVRKAIESPGEKEIYAHAEVITYPEMMKQLSASTSFLVSLVQRVETTIDDLARPTVTGKDISYEQITGEQLLKGMASHGISEVVAHEFLEMYQSIEEFGCELSRRPHRVWPSC